MNPVALQKIIDRAQHDLEIDAVLCGWGAKFIAHDTDMPVPLREYIAQKLESFSHSRSDKRGKRGRHPRSNFLRDFAVMYVIARIVEIGFDPTRTRTRHGKSPDSACSIAHAALKRLGVHMDETNVEKIWESRSQLPQILKGYIEGSERLSWPVRT
jgi:hypothetical protein